MASRIEEGAEDLRRFLNGTATRPSIVNVPDGKGGFTRHEVMSMADYRKLMSDLGLASKPPSPPES